MSAHDTPAPGAAARRGLPVPLLGLLAVPALAFLLVLLFLPLLELVKLSAGSGAFEPYVQAFSDPAYVTVIARSFQIGALSALICLLLAYPVAYFLATTTPLAAAVGFMFVMLPFWTSLLMRTYAWMVLLGRNGVVNRTLLDAGLISEPLPIIYNLTGVLVGTVHYLVPYMVFPIYAAMKRIDGTLVLAAEGLGAGSLSVFFRVYLPLTLKGVIAGVALVFIIALSAFVTPALLGGGRVVMIANLIQMQVSQLLNWPLAGALSVIVVISTIAAYGLLGAIGARLGEKR